MADMGQNMISHEREVDHKEDLGLPASIRFSDQSDPRLKMTQSEFLEQLSVSTLHKESCTDKGLDTIKTRTSAHQKSSIVSRLRSHLKPLLKARRNAREQVPDKPTENSDKTPKKPRWDSDSLNVKNTTEEPVGSGKPDVSDNITSLNTLTYSSRISGHYKDVTPTKIVSGKVFVSLSRLDITSNFAAKSFKSQSSNTVDVDLVKSELSPRQSTSARNSLSPKTSKSASESQRSTFENNDAGPRNKGSSTVSHGSPSCTKSSESSKNTGNGSAPQNTRSSSLSPIRSTKAVASPEKTSKKENGTSPEVSGFPSCSTSIKVSPSAKPIKRESSSFSPGRCSISKDDDSEKNMSETSSPLAKIFKIAKNTQKLIPDKLAFFQEFQSPKLNRSGRIIKPRKPRGKYKKKIRIRNEIGRVLQICRAEIWYPPTLPPNEVPSTEIIKAPRLKIEYRVPVIPLNPTPVVSPLQPLAFIGRHLLKNQCGECGRVFNSTNALESHVSLHKFLRPFTCKLCGKHYPDAITFKRHDRVHRNGRIYVCPQCGKGFVYRFALSKHVQMVHGKVKPFICQLCNKRFFTKRDVNVHIRIHTGEKPFQCHICERRFTRRVELNVHFRWHNGEKRHWCPHCGKGFLDSNNMKRHAITHTGEKPFSCSLCPKRYTQTGHLKKHIRNVHSVVETQDIQQNAVLN
ncbi:zinc finger protein 37 [Nematolebias whitei]|uniref:zinc finger protein 37 n=1 Tax=Nematolebias whitei TaxID=451745 RepID=UPI00189AF9BD|nr:zinc finger protein 37 [Nematolebias whitei]